jgi:hypothetical protein
LRELGSRTATRHSGTLTRSMSMMALIVVGWLPLVLLFYLLQGRLAP